MLKKIIKKLFNIIKNYYFDKRASNYLKYNANKKHSLDKPMKVGFIVFEPETWDKLEPVYCEFKARTDISVCIIVVPSFDQELRLTTHYGNELEYFRKVDTNCILAYANNKWIDIENDGYDYVFYQDPYNDHMPSILNSDNVVRFSKICYIPYGMTGSKVFIPYNVNKTFFRNVYCEFTDIQEIQSVFENRYKNNIKKGYQHFILTGYPGLLRFFKYEYRKQFKNVLWTPRWSYHPVIGGSNFKEYKDGFLKLANDYPDINFKCRPHPMMFKNFINEGCFTEEEKNLFIEQCITNGIEISEGRDIDSDFKNTDILLTDFSSIIPTFYMTKRPIIYCASHIQFNDFYGELAEGIYVAKTWEDVVYYLDALKDGNDYLLKKRIEIIEKLSKLHFESEKRIVDYLIKDYKCTSEQHVRLKK